MRISGTVDQIKLMADFCANLAVAWFVAAFVSPVDWLTTLRSIVSMVALQGLSLYLLERVK